MNIEKHRAFIESLEGEKGLPDEWRVLTPGLDKWQEGDEFLHSAWHGDAESFHWRCASLFGEVIEAGAVGRRPTYRQIPDLKERVKELVRDGMDAQHKFTDAYYDDDISGSSKLYADLLETVQEFRALCAEVKP